MKKKILVTWQTLILANQSTIHCLTKPQQCKWIHYTDIWQNNVPSFQTLYMPVTSNTLLYVSTLWMFLCLRTTDFHSANIAFSHTTATKLLLSAEWYWIKRYFMHWQMSISDWDWKRFLLISVNSFIIFQD